MKTQTEVEKLSKILDNVLSMCEDRYEYTESEFLSQLINYIKEKRGSLNEKS
jgi:hypothetical protein